LFIGWGVILALGYIVMRKWYSPLLGFEGNEYLKDLFNFGFRFNAEYRHSHIFRSLNIYNTQGVDKTDDLSNLDHIPVEVALPIAQLPIIPVREEELSK
jgi:hypothetical protein